MAKAGSPVGSALQGRVMLVDDVNYTAGTAIREVDGDCYSGARGYWLAVLIFKSWIVRNVAAARFRDSGDWARLWHQVISIITLKT